MPTIIPLADPGRRNLNQPSGAPQQITKVFPFQSYFDSAYEALTPNPGSALLEQPPNSGIIQSTVQKNQTEAYAVGLAPWSEAPVAIQMQTADAGGFSTPLILRPGEVLAPAGLAQGEQFRNFRGFEWGLPFGWLGGGLVSLFLFKSPDSLPNWTYGAKEVCFHTFQTEIIQSSIVPPNPQRTNWPNRFPWFKAFRGVGTLAFNQANSPNFSVSPTKTLLRLNGVSLAQAEPCRVVFWGTDTLDHGADGITPVPTQSSYWEFNWADNTSGGFASQGQLLSLPQEFSTLAANSWGITIEAPAGSDLIGETVNLARFGLI